MAPEIVIDKLVTLVVGGVTAIFAFFGRRFFKRVDMLTDRVDTLEKIAVTRDQCYKLRDDSNAKITSLEQKIDRQAERIDKKLDEHYRELTRLIIELGNKNERNH